MATTKASAPYDLKLVSLKDNKVLGEDSGPFNLEPRWLQAKVSFHPVGDKDSYIKAADLLREDGKHALR